jgi:hypothetical protein
VNTDDSTNQPSGGAAAAGHTSPRYEICVKGRLEARWAAWFDGLEITDPGDGTTVLLGPVVDQAALHGLLQRLGGIGVHLVSLREVLHDAPDQEGH